MEGRVRGKKWKGGEMKEAGGRYGRESEGKEVERRGNERSRRKT